MSDNISKYDVGEFEASTTDADYEARSTDFSGANDRLSEVTR